MIFMVDLNHALHTKGNGHKQMSLGMEMDSTKLAADAKKARIDSQVPDSQSTPKDHAAESSANHSLESNIDYVTESSTCHSLKNSINFAVESSTSHSVKSNIDNAAESSTSHSLESNIDFAGGRSINQTAEGSTGISAFDYQAIQLMATLEVPSEVTNDKSLKLCSDIDANLRKTYPAGRSTAFGSVITGLAFQESEYDVHFNPGLQETNDVWSTDDIDRNTELEITETAKRILETNPSTFQNIIALPGTKTYLVKFLHVPTQVNGNLSFSNGVCVRNSVLIQFYMTLDPRIKPMMMVIKHWGRIHKLTGRFSISNYALVWMVLYYLQQLRDPVIPTVAVLQGIDCQKCVINGWDCSFTCDIMMHWQTRNQSSVQELLVGFFRLYAHSDFELAVVCPLLGILLPKSMFYDVEKLPSEMKPLKEKMKSGKSEGLKVGSTFCVQDPFLLEHNITVSVSNVLMGKFQSLCASAEKICTSNQQLQVLFKLCNNVEKTEIESLSEITISQNGNFASMSETFQNFSDVTLKDQWYSKVYQSLVDIFENILKLEVYERKSDGGPEQKVCKLDFHSNASPSGCSSEDDSSRMILVCSAYFCVWEVYRVSSLDYFKLMADSVDVECIQKMATIEQQKDISNFIVDNFSKYFGMKQPGDKNPVLSFTCQFLPKQNPVRVLLKFLCDSRNQLEFVSLLLFLKTNLSKWIQES